MKYYIQDGTTCMVTIEDDKIKKNYIYNKAYKQNDGEDNLEDITYNEDECHELVKWFVNNQKGKNYTDVVKFINHAYHEFNKKDLTKTLIEALANKHKCSLIEAFQYIGDAHASDMHANVLLDIILEKDSLTYKEKGVVVGAVRNFKEHSEHIMKLLDINTEYTNEVKKAIFGDRIFAGCTTFKYSDYRYKLITHLKTEMSYDYTIMHDDAHPSKIKNIKDRYICALKDIVNSDTKPLSVDASIALSSRFIDSYCKGIDTDNKIKVLELVIKDINNTIRKNEIGKKYRYLDSSIDKAMLKDVYDDMLNKFITSTKALSVIADTIID